METRKVDINEAALKAFVEKMRPEDLETRKELDIGYSWDGSVAFLFEIRSRWDNPLIIDHFDFAKIRYYKSKWEWKLYWKRASGKWDPYQPQPLAQNLQDLLEVIDKDNHGCFFG